MKESEYKLSRLEALTDGVFAIAMTILVLAIDIPEINSLNEGSRLHNSILAQSNQLLNYLISFLLLAIFWTINHRQFRLLAKTNKQHIWINIFSLIFICLVPYTTSLKSAFPNDWMSNLYFNLNMLFIGFVYMFNWKYVIAHSALLIRKLKPNEIKNGKVRTLIFVLIAAIASICSFIIPNMSSSIYFLIPALKIGYSKFSAKNEPVTNQE